MSYNYSENILVQESAGNLLRDELGWDVQFAYNTEILGKNGTFGRESYKEILLLRYFREALKKINPWINDNQISEAQKQLENRLSTSSLLQINEEKYFLIRDGIPVTVKKQNGQTETKKAAVIDFQNLDNNYFLAIKELKIHGDLYRRRTDIVGFVNGIPLLFVELKKNTVDVQNAYDDNYTDYQDTIPHLFYYNASMRMLISILEKEINDSLGEDVSKDLRDFSMKLHSKLNNITDVMFAFSVLMLALKMSLKLSCRLLYRAICGIDLFVLNDDNIINIEKRTSTVVSEFYKVFAQDIHPDFTGSEMGSILLIDCDLPHGTHIHEFGMLIAQTLNLAGEFGSSAKYSFVTVNEELIHIHQLVWEVLRVGLPVVN